MPARWATAAGRCRCQVPLLRVDWRSAYAAAQNASPHTSAPSQPALRSDLAMAPFFGNSVACRIAEAHEINHSTLVLGDWRAAQRIEFYIGRNGEGVDWPWKGGGGADDEIVVVPPALSPRSSKRS